MLEYDFEESIGCWVVSTARLLEQALNEELASHGITFRQWQALGWLAMEGSLSQSQLAERMQIEAPTLVSILDRMERDGWIARESDEKDRRKKMIRPTPRVQPVWDKIVRAARKVRARATHGVSPDDLARVKRVLTRIQANLKEHNAIPEIVS